MEPAFTVAQEPPVPPHHQLGHQTHVHGGTGWRGPVRCALAAVFFLAVTFNFAFAAYRARHSGRDLAFVLVTYTLLALLVCCVARLQWLLRRDLAAGGGKVTERKWLRIAVWCVSVALANTFANRVADAMPRLELKLVVWGVTAVLLALGFYFIFFSKDGGECCGDEEVERGRDGVVGHRPAATGLHGLSPEEKV